MKVQILNSLAGIYEGKDYAYGKGAVVDLPANLAKDLIKSKLAKQLNDNKKSNTKSNRV